MEMYNVRTIEYQGKPLFQSASMVSPAELNSTLENTACFFYVLKGTNETIESNGSFISREREGLLKSCGNFISRYMRNPDDCDFEAVVIFFYPEFIKEIYKNEVPSFLSNEAFENAPRKIVGNELIEKFINGLFIYFENEDLMDAELARLKVKELIMILLKSNYFDGVVEFFREMFSPRNKSFREVVENNIFSNITLDQLSFLTHRSLSAFKREFKKEFNESPARFIKNRKLEEAARKLLTTNDSISNIAFDCGFQDLSTFSASFNHKYSVPPTRYRLTQISK